MPTENSTEHIARTLSVDISGLTTGTVYTVKFQTKGTTGGADALTIKGVVIAVESY